MKFINYQIDINIDSKINLLDEGHFFFYFLMGQEDPQDFYLFLSMYLSQLGVYMEYAEG